MRGRESDGGGRVELGTGGVIAGGAPYRLYYLIASGHESGRFTLDDPHSIRWEIYFQRGTPHLVHSSSPNLGLGRYLLAQRILTEEQIGRAQVAVREEGGDLVEVLARFGDIEYAEVYRILIGYSRALLVRALAVDGGSYRWEAGLAPPAGSQPLGDRWELLCEAGRRLRSDLVLGRLGPWVNAPLGKGDDERIPLQDLGLNAHERRVVAALDGSRSLAQLAASAPHEAERIYRTGYLLLQLGKLGFTAKPSGAHAHAGAAQQRLTGPFDAAFTPAPAAAIRASSIAALLDEALAEAAASAPPAEGVGAASASAAVGAEVSAGPAAAGAGAASVSRATGRAAAVSAAAAGAAVGAGTRSAASSAGPAGAAGARAAPVRTSAGPAARAGAAARDVSAGPLRGQTSAPQGPSQAALLEGLDEKDHFEVLGVERTASSAEIKKTYLRLARIHHPDRASPQDRKAKERITSRLNEAYAILGNDARRAEYLDALEITGGPEAVDIANLLEAEKLFRQATLLIKARRYKEAIAELDRAIALNDAEGEFYAWRAFARFSSTPDKRQVEKETFAELTLAMEKSPNASVPHLLAGRAATVLGDVRGAIRYYQRCLALEPGNIEAQRELRLLESRMPR